MSLASIYGNRWLKGFASAASLFLFSAAILNLQWPVGMKAFSIGLAAGALHLLFAYLSQRLQAKELRRLLYQLIEELEMELVNLGDFRGLDGLRRVIDQLQRAKLKNIRDLNEIYARSGLGYLTFAADLKIAESHMDGLASIFGKKEPFGSTLGHYLIENSRLSPSQRKNFEFHLTNIIGMGSVQWKISSTSFLKEIDVYTKGKKYSLKLSYIPHVQEDKVISICMIFQDISEHRMAQTQAVRREQEIEKIFALLKVSDSLFDLFMEETRELFDEIKKDLKLMGLETEVENITQISGRMFRNVHTIKANAKLFKLHSIEDVSHEVETYLGALKEEKVSFSQEALGQLTQKVMAISQEIYSYASLRKEIISSFDRKKDQNLRYRIQWIRSLLSQFAYMLRDPNLEPLGLKALKREFGRALSSFDKLSIKDYIKGYDRMVQDMASRTGKKIAPLDVHLDVHHFDGKTLSKVNDILVHCLRNAVDHGIETPEKRNASGKIASGLISIRSHESSGLVNLTVDDDGAGIDINKIKQKALAKGILTPLEIESMNDDDVIELLFRPGFSTAEKLSHTSGRGVGMDAIRESARQLHGELKIQHLKGSGTRLTLEIPSGAEEFLHLFSVFDLKKTSQNLIDEFNILCLQAKLKLIMDEAFVFGDRWAFAEIFRKIVQEILEQCKQQGNITVRAQPHRGRRRFDSHHFYRFEFVIKSSLIGFEICQSPIIEQISQRLENMYGSLILKDAYTLELNIPSNIPLPLSSYQFPILVFANNPENIAEVVESFFQKVVSNWQYDLFVVQPGIEIPEKFKEHPSIAIVESHCIPHYMQARDEDDRRQDGVLLITTAYAEIENLSETSVRPENIIFVPLRPQDHSLERSLAAMILRRFHREMASNSGMLNDIDREILEKMAV